uniref:Uncharacterized protein n=1 Tax=Anguilla anguilla TaxID=7936 RepID=A0A0E9PSL5_ANGAN
MINLVHFFFFFKHRIHRCSWVFLLKRFRSSTRH